MPSLNDVWKVGGEFPTLPIPATTDSIVDAIKQGRWRGSKASLDAIRILTKMHSVEQFNFGKLQLNALREVQKEALDFIEYGCFALPFPECVYRCAVEFDNKPVGFHIYAVQSNTDKSIACLGTIHSLNHVLTFRSDHKCRIEYRGNERAVEIRVPQKEIAFWEPYIGPVEQDLMVKGNAEILTEGSLIMMGLTMVLNTKGVLKERVAPPEKPNKVRAKQGRPLLPYVTRVYTSVYNDAIREGTPGTHASPRPHRRRAHVRHIPARNNHPAYVVPIEAMLVNWDGAPLEARKEYKVVER